MLSLFPDFQKMPIFNYINRKLIYAQAEASTKIASKVITAADPDDQTAGDSYYAA